MNSILLFLFNIGFDSFFSVFFINNLVVFVWRIIWDTQDLYLRSNLFINSILSVVIFTILMVIVKYKQIKSLETKYTKKYGVLKHKPECSNMNNNNNSDEKKIDKKKKNRWFYNLKLKIFILIFAFANINHWRGVWNFTIYYTNESVIGIFTIGIISFVSLIAMKRFCALTSVPFMFSKDSKQSAYQIPASAHKTKFYFTLDQESQVSLFHY